MAILMDMWMDVIRDILILYLNIYKGLGLGKVDNFTMIKMHRLMGLPVNAIAA